ncbi:O-antigen ligase family protein [Acidicapsa acidisoli]|uniref:O-antigen ligase family protein n=1 Tax=Acidicapsa acidisoli TaxID=1615681 RepID=UPI0021E05141|nr:hypothetical protein [Acidicapsa acidisoli]
MTPLGYILLPVGFAGLLLSAKWLYRLFVFWTLFSASSAINLGDSDSGSALQVWMVFAFLWLLRLLLERLSTLSFAIDRRVLRLCLWLIGFLAVAGISLVMPAYINGRLTISSPILGENTETPLYLSSHNVTQLLYLVFGGLVAICVAHVNLRDEDRHETEKVIMISAIFISIWGLFQFFCNVTGMPYPDFIFNNSGSASGKGFLQTLDNGISRVSSTAVEPSVLAQSLITLLPLTLPAWLRNGSVFSVPIDRLASLLFLLLLLLSTSSTAYVGVFIFGALLVPLLVRTRAISKGKAILLIVIGALATTGLLAAAVLSVPIVGEMVNSAILSKSTSGSGIERAMTIALAYGYFVQYPILGIGWGSATSHDLIIKLLSNVGILGTLAFLGAMFSVIRADWRALDSLRIPSSLSRSAWFLSLAVFLATSILIEFPLVFGNFWLVVGMAIAVSWKSDGAQERKHGLESA